MRYQRVVTVALLRVAGATAAGSLARALRPMDLLATSGPDTLLAILPELDRAEGRVAVDRLVELARIAGLSAQFAVALCPDDGATATALLERLRAALPATADAPHVGEPPVSSAGMREHLAEIERAAIVAALAAVNGNQTLAARRLGVSRRTIIYKMEKYGLKPLPGRGG